MNPAVSNGSKPITCLHSGFWTTRKYKQAQLQAVQLDTLTEDLCNKFESTLGERYRFVLRMLPYIEMSDYAHFQSECMHEIKHNGKLTAWFDPIAVYKGLSAQELCDNQYAAFKKVF